MKKKYKILFILIGIFALAEVATIGVMSLNKSYSINSLSNLGNNYTLRFDKVKNSAHYIVRVKENNNTIIEKEIDKTIFNFELKNTNYDSQYELSVVAVKKNGEEEVIDDDYAFRYTEPKFSDNNSLVLNNNKNIIYLDGKPNLKDYEVDYYIDDKYIGKDKVNSNIYEVSNIVLKENSIVKAVLKYKNYELDERIFYVNVNPVGDITITNMKDEDYVDASTFKIDFKGGENANKFFLVLEADNKTVDKIEIINKDEVIKLTKYNINKKYKISLIAQYDELEKKASVNVYLLSHYRYLMVKTALEEYASPDKQKGGLKYCNWYASWGRFEWCAVFISWIANQHGLMGKTIPKFIGCETGAGWFMKKGLFKNKREYTPEPGDIVFFTWYDPDKAKTRIGHVGLVIKVENGRIYTIEGNVTDQIVNKNYPIDGAKIAGYARPEYPE